MKGAWICIKIGTAACHNIIHLAAWMIAAYMAVHTLPPACKQADCHFVIPPAEFMPAGMFAPGATPPITGPIAEGLTQGPGAFWPTGTSLPGRPGGGADPLGETGGQPPIVTDPPAGGVPRGESIPEPSTLQLLGVGLIVLAAVRWRRRSRPY